MPQGHLAREQTGLSTSVALRTAQLQWIIINDDPDICKYNTAQQVNCELCVKKVIKDW